MMSGWLLWTDLQAPFTFCQGSRRDGTWLADLTGFSSGRDQLLGKSSSPGQRLRSANSNAKQQADRAEFRDAASSKRGELHLFSIPSVMQGSKPCLCSHEVDRIVDYQGSLKQIRSETGTINDGKKALVLNTIDKPNLSACKLGGCHRLVQGPLPSFIAATKEFLHYPWWRFSISIRRGTKRPISSVQS
jgi:hypothetical protein